MINENIKLGKDVRFGQNVVATGVVSIGDYTSIWHNVVLRGDVEPIIIGRRCNIQDSTVVHGQYEKWATTLGNNISVGHSCILHGCELADNSFIGMGTILLNGSYIGSNILVAAGSLVPQNTRFEEPGTLVMGRPAKVVRELKENEIEMILNTPGNYINYARKWLPAESK